ncbi:MAG TPA: hypothetical protein VMB71_11630 [Acetobacteraceae bacterium]|nr:hypothetical protein [Acetobacteraceae bacterium]
MHSFVRLVLHRIGYDGDIDTLCISSLSPWPILFLTGGLAILAASIFLRLMVDMILPAGITQRLAGSRAMVHWTITVTLLGVLAAAIEAVGAEQRVTWMEWVQNLSTTEHPLAATGLACVAAGLLLTVRAMALLQIDMFRRPAGSGVRGVPTDGAFVQAGAFALRGFASREGWLRKPGGGIPIALLGVLMAAYGSELLRHVDLCL